MWILASSHATHFPFIQIFAAFCMAIVHLAVVALPGLAAKLLDDSWGDACDVPADASPAFFVRLARSPERIRDGELRLAGRGPPAEQVGAVGVHPERAHRGEMRGLH